jgi:hypothetical protein
MINGYLRFDKKLLLLNDLSSEFFRIKPVRVLSTRQSIFETF